MDSQFYKAVKRLFDIVASGAAILVLSPILLSIALGIKLSSKGPVFYKSMRSGMNHREFTMYKFRSMHLYQPENPQSGKTSEGGYIANEERIFPFGRFLRKSKLDELPQLLNVLLSDMSVVGPRPVTEKTVKKNYQGKYECIMHVKPGLACLDSLYDYAHGELFVQDEKEYTSKVLPVRTELARMYVSRRSICLDGYCILRTIWLIFQIIILRKRTFIYTKYEDEAVKATQSA